MRTNFTRWLLAGLGLLAVSVTAPSSAAPIQIAEVKKDNVDFEKEILPIFRKNCLACHNGTQAESDLVMETPQTILKGGSEGPAVVAGKSADSLLLKLAAHQKDPIMPPKKNDVGAKPLSPQELGLIKLWIDQGAKGEVKKVSTAVVWQPLPAGVSPIYAVAVSRNGDFAAAGRANQIFTYHVPSKRELGRLTDPAVLKSGIYKNPGVAHLDIVQSLALSPDGSLLVSGGYREVKFWRKASNVKKADLAGLDALTRSVAVSPDGKWAACGEENGKIMVFDLEAGKLSKTLTGHTGPVTGVAFSADNAKLASGSQDKTWRLWNLADSKELFSIATPAPVNAVAFVGEGKQLATGEADNLIRVWAIPAEPPAAGAEPPKPAVEIKGHTGPITSLANIDAAGAQLLSGSQDGTVRQWTVATAAMIKQFAHGAPVEAVAARSDGQRFASASTNNTAKIWNATSGAAIAELKGDFRKRQAVAESGRTVAMAKRQVDLLKADLKAANDRKAAEEKNVKTTEEAVKKADEDFKKKDEAAKKPVADKEAAEKVLADAKAELAKSEAAKKTADEAATKAAEVLKQAQETLKAATADDAKATAQKAVDEATAAQKTADEAKKKADAEFTSATAKVKTEEGKVTALTAPATKAVDEKNSAERALKAAERSVERAKESVKKADEEIAAVDASVKQSEEAAKGTEAALADVTKVATESEKPLKSIAFSRDGLTVATGGDGQSVATWDAETGAALDSFTGQGATITTVAFLADGNLLSVAANNTAAIFNTAMAWNLERTIGSTESGEKFTDRVLSLAFSWDGKLLATGSGEPSRSGELKIWNAETGELVREFKDAHSDTIFAIDFSRDGKYLATCAADRFVKVFEVATGKFVRSFEGHTHHVLGVSWSADGRTLVSAGADKVLKVWDARTGDQKRTVQGFGKEVTGVRFVGETTNVCSPCGDKTVRLTNADNGGNVRQFTGAGDFMYSVDVTGDGKTIVAGGQDSVVRMWQEAGAVYATFNPPAPEQTAAAPAPANK